MPRPLQNALPDPSPWENRRILVVEDNLVNQKVTLALLGQLGFTPDVASSGQEALSRIRIAEYDMILLDLELPDISGLEVSRRWRASESSTSSTKSFIVALSAHSSNERRRACLQAGMNDYVSKPLRLETLRALLNKAFQTSLPEEMLPAAPLTETGKDDFSLDSGVLQELRMLAEDPSGGSILDLVTIFFEDSPGIYENLVKAVKDQDLPKVTHAAHKLAGSASLFGAQTFSELCRSMENAARAGNLAQVGSMMPQVRKGFEKTLLQLEELKATIERGG